MGQGQSSVFDLAAIAAASNGGNNDPLLPPARFIGAPQKPSKMPYNKYVAYDKQVPFDFPERTWPGKRLQRAPRWCSVDLRDGNQALVNPMDSERKLRFWNLLVSVFGNERTELRETLESFNPSDRKSTRLNSSHSAKSRMPSSA